MSFPKLYVSKSRRQSTIRMVKTRFARRSGAPVLDPAKRRGLRGKGHSRVRGTADRRGKEGGAHRRMIAGRAGQP